MPTLFDLVYTFVSVAFICVSYQRGSYSAIAKVSALKHHDNSCYCYDHSGKIYNLTPLKTTVFNVSSKKYSGQQFSYSPCSPFKTGPEGGECQEEDVAVGQCKCRLQLKICWVSGNVHTVIGNQSLLKWHVNKGKKKLTYETTGDYHNHPATVKLNCNESKTEDADFELLDDDEWTFQLTHLCACGDGCQDPDPTTKSPTQRFDPMRVVIPVITSAGTAVLLLVIFVVRGIVKERNNAGNNEERRHLLENGVADRHVDEVHDPIQESLEELSRPAPIGSSHGKR